MKKQINGRRFLNRNSFHNNFEPRRVPNGVAFSFEGKRK